MTDAQSEFRSAPALAATLGPAFIWLTVPIIAELAFGAQADSQLEAGADNLSIAAGFMGFLALSALWWLVGVLVVPLVSMGICNASSALPEARRGGMLALGAYAAFSIYSLIGMFLVAKGLGA